MSLDTVSWVAIALAVLLLVGVFILDKIEHRRDPDLHSRMPGAVVFAGALLIGALLR